VYLCLHRDDGLAHGVGGARGQRVLVLEVLSVSGLALPAGAEVQLPGGLLPVDVGDVLGRGAAQPPPRPAARAGAGR